MIFQRIPVLAIMSATLFVDAQRSPYAGRTPIGYPQIDNPTDSTTITDTLGNRAGNDENNSTTTAKLPLEALGDKALVDRLKKLPIDHQPFWLINWQALESFREKPQTYEHRPNNFIKTFFNSEQNLTL